MTSTPDFFAPSPLTTNLNDVDPASSSSGHGASSAQQTCKGTSLSTNYFPSKFSTGLLSPTPRRRKGRAGLVLPKQGGGREAFRINEPRMPVDGDEDYDGVNGGLFSKEGDHTRPRMRWTMFKWILFVANTCLSLWSLAGLIFCLLTWFDVFQHADIVRVGNHTELILSTFAATISVITSVIGWAGILLNNRSFLAVYTFLLWISFAMLVTPGYVTYKKRTFDLEGKLNAQWSRDIGPPGRLRIQDRLHCCGYFNPFVEATVSQTCYARTILPGCKSAYFEFEKGVLELWYTIVFAIVPLQLGIMVAGLLCSNHVTYRFGKGMMPKAYRLSMASTAVIIDSYASQLASQYGAGFASDILTHSRAGTTPDSVPGTPVFSANGSSIFRRSVPVINL